MTPQEEINLVKKVLDLNKENWIFNQKYFDPEDADEFVNTANLKPFGFSVESTKVEGDLGTTVKSALIGPDNKPWELGSLLMGGKDTIILEDLRLYDDVFNFVKGHLMRISNQQVELNSN